MKTFTGALCLAACSALAANAAPPKAAVMAPIHQFIDSFNRGDIKSAEAAHLSAPAIIDEVPPHVWQGAGAFQAWVGDLDKASKAAGLSQEKVTLGSTLRAQVDGDTAYAVVRATYTYVDHGKAMIEPAQMTFALHKETGGWKIAAWAWTGTTPHPAAKAKP